MNNKQADLTVLFDIYCDVKTSSSKQNLKMLRGVDIDNLICKNKETAYNYLRSDISDKKKVFWMNKLYDECGLTDYDLLLNMLRDSSEVIFKTVEKLILDKEKKTRKLLEKIIPELEDETGGRAKRILMYWDYLRVTKSKINITNKKQAYDYSSKNIEFYCSQQITWLPQKLYTLLHWADEEDKDVYIQRHVIRYVLSEYMTLPRPVRIHACDAIVALINPTEWHDFIELIYQNWLKDDANESHMTILAPYCMYAKESDILQLRYQIKLWIRDSRYQLIEYASWLLGARASAFSLFVLNEIMEMTNDARIRSAAEESFKHVARLKRIPVDELADKSIPSLGFNRKGEVNASYGTRTFRVTLLPDMSTTVYDLERKTQIVKMLFPAKSDDFELAEENRIIYSNVKRVAKIQAHLQRKRLMQALKDKRTWSKKLWTSIFVDKAFIRFLVPGLIWGTYKEEQLQQSFICTDDGMLQTVSGKEYKLRDDALISLVHPIDLSEELVARWKEQLDHYRIVPFFPQLDSHVFRFKDMTTKDEAIIFNSDKPALLSNIYEYENDGLSVLIVRQSVYIIDRPYNILLQMPYVIDNNNAILQELSFSYINEDDSFTTIELPKEDRIPLSSLPKRYISDKLYLLSKVYPLR